MINFLQKEKPGGVLRHNYDVSVTYSHPHSKENEKTLRFSFSLKAVKMICGNGFFANVGLDENYPDRIYFCSSNEKKGYKMSKSEKFGYRYSCTFGKNVKYTKPVDFVGYYNLEYDAKQGALYIDKKNKKGE